MRRGIILILAAALFPFSGYAVPTAPVTDTQAPPLPASVSRVDDPDHGSFAMAHTPRIIQRPVYTLKECIDTALRQNPDILIAKKNVEAAVGGITVARAAFLPQLQANGLAQRDERGFGTVQEGDPTLRDEDYYVTVQVTESIFSGGANTSKMKIARLTHSSALLAYQAAIDTVILNVRLAYYGILLSQANIEVRRQAVELLHKQVANENDRWNAGLTSHNSLLRVQVSEANEMPALISAQNQMTNGYVQLSQLLAIPYKPGESDAPFEVTGSLGYEPRKYDLSDCLQKAVAARPEVKAKENQIEIEEKQLVVDRSAILPKVNLFAGYDVTSEQSRDALHSYEDGYVAGVSGSWQIFDGFATFGKMKSTRARMQAAIAARDAERLQIEADVRLAWNQLDQASKTVESQGQNVLLAREGYVLSNASYEAGIVTQLDALQSRVDLTTAQTTEFQARYDYLAATAQLQRALSGQFQIVNDTLPPTAPATEPLPSGLKKPDAKPDANGNGGTADPSFPPPSAPLPGAAPSNAAPLAPLPEMTPLPSNAPSGPLPPSNAPSPLAPPGAAPYPSSIPNSSSRASSAPPRTSAKAALPADALPALPQ